MKPKIMYIPLDERPCNYSYPKEIMNISNVPIVLPPFSIMGEKKKPANINKLQEWILNNIDDISHLILSIDMFLYGGIVPSRLHKQKVETLKNKLELLEKIKERNPKLKIYAYNLIMRVPSYNSSDEEPDYYEKYGEKIFEYGALLDKLDREKINKDENEKIRTLEESIPTKFLNDYLNRRSINHEINLEMTKLIKDEIIDFLIIPMDDNSEYSFSSKERRKITNYIQENEIMDKIYSYPGADEVGSILVARSFSDIYSYKPKVFIRYSSEKGKNIIPRLEDRPLSESVKYQVIAAGGITVDNSQIADYILMVNPPSETTIKEVDGWHSLINRPEINDPERNLHDFIKSCKSYINSGFNCAIADVAMVNGSDPVLMKLLKKNRLLDEILSYGGWNTSSNTLGTVVAHAQIVSFFININQFNKKRMEKSKKFLYLRYLEDWGYQHKIRTEISNDLENYSLNYFDLGNKGDLISKKIKKNLIDFSNENLKEFNYDFEVYMPWNRMFEVGITIK